MLKLMPFAPRPGSSGWSLIPYPVKGILPAQLLKPKSKAVSSSVFLGSSCRFAETSWSVCLRVSAHCCCGVSCSALCASGSLSWPLCATISIPRLDMGRKGQPHPVWGREGSTIELPRFGRSCSRWLFICLFAERLSIEPSLNMATEPMSDV